MRIVKQEVLSRKGNPYFVYKYSNGKFANKQLFEAQENMEPKKGNKRKKSRKVSVKEQEAIIKDSFPELVPVIDEVQLNPEFVETINNIEDNIANLDKQEEWVGESGVFSKQEIKEGAQIVDLKENYKQQVIEFEQSIEQAFEKPVIGLTIGEDKIEEPKKGFFVTWFEKWGW